jgi:hypothetical protein
MSSRVFTHLFRVSLAFRTFYSSQRLHMEVNTSHSYHNLNRWHHLGAGPILLCGQTVAVGGDRVPHGMRAISLTTRPYCFCGYCLLHWWCIFSLWALSLTTIIASCNRSELYNENQISCVVFSLLLYCFCGSIYLVIWL